MAAAQLAERTLQEAVSILSSSRRVAVLTGAGVSKESGIPTFRDAQTGLWAKYDAEELASPSGFRANPQLVWQWYDGRRKKLQEVTPNPGHFAIAQMAGQFEEFHVLTQNVDGLHQVAGSTNVLELHGNITSFRCFERGHAAHDVPLGLEGVPRCHCGSFLRPSVVWFGEALSESCLRGAQSIAQSSDLMLVVGTSGLVYPAASLPFLTIEKGGKVIEINPEPTPLTGQVDVFLQAPSGTALPQLLARLRERQSDLS
jgi:NAD-dependent deacetylase